MNENTPRRVRWGRRIGLTLAALGLVAVLGHGLWFYLTWRGVKTRIEKLQQAGEPILPADFVAADVDSSQNAVNDLIEIGDAIDSNGELKARIRDLDPAIPLTADERTSISSALQVLEKHLEQLDGAAAKPRVDWPMDQSQPVLLSQFANNLSNVRSIANVLGVVVLLDHELGKDNRALQRLDRILFVSRCADRHPSLIGHLIGIGCGVLASNRIYEIAPDLRIGGEPGQAPPQDVRRLIDALLDDEQQFAALKLSLRGERMMQLDSMQALIGGMPADQVSGAPTKTSPTRLYAIKPYFRHNSKVLLDYMTGMIQTVGEPNLPAAMAKLPAPPAQSKMNLLASILMPSLGRCVETHYRGMTERRLAAVALAIRWYAVEHDGQLPKDLKALVPQYLPRVPNDPMAANERPLSFDALAEKPIVYSVGSNATDDGGSEQAIKRQSFLPNEWDMRDRVVHLKRQPRKPSYEEQLKLMEAEPQ